MQSPVSTSVNSPFSPPLPAHVSTSADYNDNQSVNSVACTIDDNSLNDHASYCGSNQQNATCISTPPVDVPRNQSKGLPKHVETNLLLDIMAGGGLEIVSLSEIMNQKYDLYKTDRKRSIQCQNKFQKYTLILCKGRQ